ncbi:uncharacterized protein G2W53_014454 [Senna tora]|uniref:Uncharacterized protein n=1 Tax=Senna tora TaxID=362788 RepID=A0A835C2N2_9FABA|nr:uncharacterized protein G2W53_014454 [Senna tora]
MTRARTEAMKEALNCFIRDLKELEPNYIKESTINMSSKSPRKVVTMLKAQQDDVQGLCELPISRHFSQSSHSFELRVLTPHTQLSSSICYKNSSSPISQSWVILFTVLHILL